MSKAVPRNSYAAFAGALIVLALVLVVGAAWLAAAVVHWLGATL